MAWLITLVADSATNADERECQRPWLLTASVESRERLSTPAVGLGAEWPYTNLRRRPSPWLRSRDVLRSNGVACGAGEEKRGKGTLKTTMI